MKKLLATLGLAVLLAPTLALADENAAPPASAQMQSRMAEFRQLHDKMRQLHQQARSQILATLSPAHKAAVANLIGQLAVSSNPNPDATARQINAVLSPAESQSILRIHQSMHSQMMALMQSMHAQMQLPPGAPAHPQRSPEMNRPVDAGHIVLMILSGEHAMMMYHPGM